MASRPHETTTSSDCDAKESETDVRFECPCGECSLETYLQYGCPHLCIPYLEMTTLSKEDQENLNYLLRKDTKIIMTNFADLCNRTCDSLIRQGITANRLVRLAVNFDSSLSDQLKRSTSVDQVFVTLAPEISFFDHDILTAIITMFGDTHDKDHLARYSKEFKEFCKRKVFEVKPGRCTCGQHLSILKGWKQLAVILPTGFQNLGEAVSIKETLADVLDVPLATLHLHRIDADVVLPVKRLRLDSISSTGAANNSDKKMKDIENVTKKIEKKEEEIESWKKKSSAGEQGLVDNKILLLLMEELKQLREELWQLREERLILLKKDTSSVVPPAKRLHLDSSLRSQGICDFWEELPGIQPENEMLVFPTEFRKIKEMFVRGAYDDLYNRYVSQYHYVVITGNPGTGKSYFSLYVLYRLRRERSDLIIVYVSAPSGIVVLFSGDTVSMAKDEAEWSSLLDREDTIYLFDAGTQGARIPYVTRSKTIVFSSPSRSNYHDFYKECILGTGRGGVMVYMPIWSWDEINKLCVMKNFRSDKAKERFDRWGGIARYIFRPMKECDASEYADLDAAIRNCVPEKVIDLATTLQGGDIKLNSHKVLHIHVTNKLPDGSLDYTAAVIYFASDYVGDRVYEKFTADSGKTLINIINCCKDGWLSGIRGQLFERFAHFHFVNHDAEYDIKCLEPAHRMFNQVTKQKFGKLIKTPLQNVAALASQKDQKGVYLKPVHQNFESLDAIIPPSVGLQMTVASSHPVKLVGLQKVINALGCTKQERFTLYFVVPRDAFDGYKKQSYLDNRTQAQKDGNTKFNAEEIVEQWVLSMDLTPKL